MTPGNAADIRLNNITLPSPDKPICAACPNGAGITLTVFDQPAYRKLIRARAETIARVVEKLKPALQLSTAVDAGCGVGFFARVLRECGLSVAGFDAREENVLEARKRVAGIRFEVGDIEKAEITEAGGFDLVLCFGLLYHLENPMLAMRHLRLLTRKALLLESMCVPGSQAEILLREEPAQEDQGLARIAFYPSEACLIKMLYRSGFAAVYRPAELPDHDDFRETGEHARRRTVFVATVTPVAAAGLELVAEPREQSDPWAGDGYATPAAGPVRRLRRFMARPARSKYISIAQRVRRVFPKMPIPLRLSFGAWWLAEHSALDGELLHGEFERAEMAAVAKLLRAGMTALDVGAHHGLYTLLMSRCVGKSGKVIAFEPSPRERKRLLRHLRANRCRNVSLLPFALGDEPGEAQLFVVGGREDWCNSLRAPAVEEQTTKVDVNVRRLDEVLEELGVSSVDFIKVDIEGAELGFLRGAGGILCDAPRPLILAEVQDVRTRPWGYAAREIIEFLARRNYRWFALGATGEWAALSAELAHYDGNFLAVPEERVHEAQQRLGND